MTGGPGHPKRRLKPIPAGLPPAGDAAQIASYRQRCLEPCEQIDKQRQEFLALAACLDLLLGPPYFGSGLSLFETLHDGTAIVTLEGRFLRSRLVAASCRLLELEGAPVAADLTGFGPMGLLAVELLRDPARRGRLRRQLRERVSGASTTARRACAASKTTCWRAFRAPGQPH